MTACRCRFPVHKQAVHVRFVPNLVGTGFYDGQGIATQGKTGLQVRHEKTLVMAAEWDNCRSWIDGFILVELTVFRKCIQMLSYVVRPSGRRDYIPSPQ